MSSTPTKKIKSALRAALTGGFRERGWSRVTGRPDVYAAPEAVVALPLSLVCDLAIDSDTYGGAHFTANAELHSDEVTELLLTFDRSSMPSVLTRWPGDEALRLGLDVGATTAGSLVDPLGNYHRWLVVEDGEVASQVDDFFAMVDGPLLRWVTPRSTVGGVLTSSSAPREDGRPFNDSVLVRTLSTLALMSDDVSTARSILAGYQFGAGDDAERLALFERELMQRYPAYGSAQRS